MPHNFLPSQRLLTGCLCSLLSAGKPDSSPLSGTEAPDVTQWVHSHSQATTSTSAGGHSEPLVTPPDPKPQQPAMDTEKLKAALQQMIAGGVMTPAAKSGQSTSPPGSSSELRLWGADLKQRLQVKMHMLLVSKCGHDLTRSLS